MEGASEGEVSMSQKESPSLAPPLSPGDEATNAGAALAKEAASLYQSKSYTECLSLLQQLLPKKENDPKVIHNIALAEFQRDGATDPYKLLDVLELVKKRCEELARAADEQLEGIGNSVSSPNGSTTGVTTKPTTSDSVGYIEDYDISIPSLNIATIYYHLKQNFSALAVLEPLFLNIEPVDETCALQICLLMLDITLASRRADKAAAVLQYVEKSYGLGQSSSDNSGAVQQSMTTLPAPALEAKNLPVGIGSAPPAASLVNSPIGEGSLAQNSGEETFEEDALSIGLEIDGSHSVRSLPARVPAIEKSPPAPGMDLKLLMHLYRVRFMLLTHGLKAAKREVKSALNLSKDNLTALLLKAQLEYTRGNYRKSMKLLTTCSNRGEATVGPMILSNLGCVYHFLKKDQTAAMFFVQALQRYTSMTKERPLKLSTFSQDKSLEVYYNSGLIQLFSGNPFLAARSFQESAPMFYNRPIFWLRIAECCISALEKGLLPGVSPKKEELKVVVVGQGKFRRLVLPSGSVNPFPTSEVEVYDHRLLMQDGITRKPLTLSLGLAQRCLRSALYLLNNSDGKAEEAAPEAKEGEGSAQALETAPNNNVIFSNGEGKDVKNGGNLGASLASFEQEEKTEKAMLRLCVLADQAFVELCLENPASALTHAEALLQQPKVTKAYSFLGHVYAAEALCLLDRIKEAEAHLESCMMDWTSTSAEFADEDGQKWNSVGDNAEAGVDEDGSSRNLSDQMNFLRFTGAQARASLYVNFAAIHALQGELPQARQCALQALAIAPGSTMAILAMVYVELAHGRSKEAVTMLKRCRHLAISRLKPRI